MPDVDAIVLGNIAVASDQHIASRGIEPAKPIPIVAITEGIILPAQSKIQGKVGRYLPLVADVPGPLRPAKSNWVEELISLTRRARQTKQTICP